MEKSNQKSRAGGGGELPVTESQWGRAVDIDDFLKVSTYFFSHCSEVKACTLRVYQERSDG